MPYNPLLSAHLGRPLSIQVAVPRLLEGCPHNKDPQLVETSQAAWRSQAAPRGLNWDDVDRGLLKPPFVPEAGPLVDHAGSGWNHGSLNASRYIVANAQE